MIHVLLGIGATAVAFACLCIGLICDVVMNVRERRAARVTSFTFYSIIATVVFAYWTVMAVLHPHH